MSHRAKSLRSVSVRAVTAMLAASVVALSATAAWGEDEVPPPIPESRATHQTLLETVESRCDEIAVPRAASWDAVRGVVPARYLPARFGTDLPLARVQLWDYVCQDLTVDGQRYAPTTQVSVGGALLSFRDGQPTTASYYLLWIETDNAELAARYQQVGLPARFSPAMSSSISDPTASPYIVSFVGVASVAHTIAAMAATAPAIVDLPVLDPRVPSLVLYRDDPGGEVALAYTNTAIGIAPATVTADFRQLTTLVPLVAQPRLLEIPGALFPAGMARGSWVARLSRTD